MLRRKPKDIDPALVRTVVGQFIESGRFDEWLITVPDQVLNQIVAPFEMLIFQYYLDPPKDRYLIRAAQVACEAVQSSAGCPEDLTLRRLQDLVCG